MRILLYDASNTRHEFNEPLGIEAIMGYLEFYHADVQVELMLWSMDGIPEQDVLQTYDIIGISLPYNSVWIVREFYKRVDFSKQILILGNSIATFGYEILLKEFPETICSLGEGEYAFEDLIYFFAGKLPLEKVRNISFRRGSRIIVNNRQEISGLKVPLPKRLEHIMNFLFKNKGTFRIEASRGCDYGRCSFCYLKGKYTNTSRREIPEESVLEQIRYFNKLGVKNPYFTDEDFIGGNYQRAIRIAKRIIALKESNDIDNSMHFYINIKATDVLQSWWQETYPMLLRAGISQVFVGIESGSTAQLKRYHKPTNIEINRNAVLLLTEEGFDAEIGFICFDPLTTINDLSENMKFIHDCRLYEKKVYLFDRLRVTIGSEYYKMTCEEIPYYQVNLDTLSYDYKFVISDVQEIWDIFSSWKLRNLEHFYAWQLKTRGESHDDSIDDIIKILNFLEYSIMCYLIKWKKFNAPVFLSIAQKIMRVYEIILDD